MLKSQLQRIEIQKEGLNSAETEFTQMPELLYVVNLPTNDNQHSLDSGH